MGGGTPGVERLEGWGPIAHYLGTSIRTAQRWEREMALPVHHAGRSKGYRVFAVPADLDRWLRSREQPPNAAAAIETIQEQRLVSALPQSAGRPHRTVGLTIGGVTAVILICFVYFGWFRRSPVNVGAITFSDQELQAWESGKVVWSYHFDQPLLTLDPTLLRERILIFSPSPTRRGEVLAAVPLLSEQEEGDSSDALYAFSPDGKLLWHDEFNRHIAFAGERAGPRWEARLILSASGARLGDVWAALESFPLSISLLQRVNSSGRQTTYFVNFGHIIALYDFRTANGSFLLEGGINNECDCGFLAVLRVDKPSGHSPAYGSLPGCDACPAGNPDRYFLFPHSEVSSILGTPYNGVIHISADRQRFQVMTSEVADTNGTADDWALYEFNDHFVPLSVTYSDHYWFDHKKLSEQGTIRHAVSACPERNGTVIRGWEPPAGWRNLPVRSLDPQGSS